MIVTTTKNPVEMVSVHQTVPAPAFIPASTPTPVPSHPADRAVTGGGVGGAPPSSGGGRGGGTPGGLTNVPPLVIFARALGKLDVNNLTGYSTREGQINFKMTTNKLSGK